MNIWIFTVLLVVQWYVFGSIMFDIFEGEVLKAYEST